jgi:transcription antitermination factor NusG
MWTTNTANKTKTELGNLPITLGLRTGTPVKVREGPFRGALGSVIERPPHRLTLIRIDVLGREVCVEVDPRHIDVLN